MPELSAPTPLGRLTLVEEGGAITELGWAPSPPRVGAEDPPSQGEAILARALACLERYFAGQLEAFDFALRPRGTAFERRVWAALRTIPYGETRTYGEVATMVGATGWEAARAVGRAVGRNPIPIIIPCHRVLAANGIGGFSAPGGIATKRALLALEARVLGPGALFQAGGKPASITSGARA